jgi:hypothetical protein
MVLLPASTRSDHSHTRPRPPPSAGGIKARKIKPVEEIAMPKQAQASTKPTEIVRHPNAEPPWEIGAAYLVRTVTNYLCGRLVWAGPTELVLEDAAWVADTGRYHEALATGKLNEVEPIPGPVILGRGSVVDAARWTHSLPIALR